MFITLLVCHLSYSQLFFYRHATIRALFKDLIGETILLIYKCMSPELVKVTGVCLPCAASAMWRSMSGRRRKA